MLFSAKAPALLAFAGAALASPLNVPMSLFETVKSAPKGWAMNGPAAKDETIELRFNLAKQNTAQFHELALNIATPGHAQYGKHLTLEQIDAVVAPKPESKDLLFQWLGNHSLADGATLNSRGNVVKVNVTISQAEALLRANYNSYTNTNTGAKASRALSIHVPQVLVGHIDVIQPTTFFGLEPLIPTANNKTFSALAQTVPSDLAKLYGLGDVPKLTSGIMGIAGFQEQWASHYDLSTFMNIFAFMGNKDHDFTCVSVVGGECPTDARKYGVEGNLDTQYAAVITSEIPNVYYSTGGDTYSLFEDLANYLLGLDAASQPNVLSVSYGGEETLFGLSLAEATCNVFAELGSAGISIIFASGDSGVGDSCNIDGKDAYEPIFPASCPWVTTVGGTSGTSGDGPEVVWDFSGGGFSNFFDRPSWQNSTVASWLTSNPDGNTQYYNSSGRAYPDVAAGADYIEIITAGQEMAVSGTSCAAPVFASIIQLVNSQRIDAGKPALGFLNPWLYSLPSGANGLNDITSGKSNGCSDTTISHAGFSAVTGWDPVTGLGSPNYPKLLSVEEAFFTPIWETDEPVHFIVNINAEYMYY
ncbi:peptidase S8/S53 domain-containing protein [Xylariaceae sp. FL1651]|nr:peptidase S8/S53 domain-containing protein [Xylariaceae sp. FL1651]